MSALLGQRPRGCPSPRGGASVNEPLKPFEWHTTQCSIMKWRGTEKCNCPSIMITNKIKRLLNEALSRRGE